MGTVETVYFEGGEAFLYYPLLLEGLRLAARLGLRAGIVTNAYWATSVEDAEIWLKPIRDIGIADLSVSDDAFHETTEEGNPAKLALAAAANLGIPCDTICIESPAPAPCQRGSTTQRPTRHRRRRSVQRTRGGEAHRGIAAAAVRGTDHLPARTIGKRPSGSTSTATEMSTFVRA